MESDEFKKEYMNRMNENISAYVTNITLDGGVKVHLSDGCYILGKISYIPPEFPGLCPSADKVLTETVCKGDGE